MEIKIKCCISDVYELKLCDRWDNKLNYNVKVSLNLVFQSKIKTTARVCGGRPSPSWPAWLGMWFGLGGA